MTNIVEAALPANVAPPAGRTIGDTDLRVFPLAMSGNVFGWTADGDTTNGILDAYRGVGGNFIDTADSYAGGRSEIMIGNWMRDRRNRDDMIIATKIGKSANNPGLSSRAIRRAVTDSLERLQTDHIDLVYLHIDDPEVPFEETLLAIDELIRAGKVRYFGASDHTANRLIEARIASGQWGVAQLVALQNQYNLMARREYEGQLAQVAVNQRLGVMPRFALASGFLTGKYRTKADLTIHPRGKESASYVNRKGLKVIAALDAIAAEKECSVASVALAWLLTKPNVVAPVVSASRPEQVAELAPAASLFLSRHQLAELDRVSD
jgi:aryl-alcohol dehydrogenase-like predicted oxidoreductase